ncbi:class I SAM-dependent methyltransferase [Massilia kyonggiensis]
MHKTLRRAPVLLALSAALLTGALPAHAADQASSNWQSVLASPLRTDDDRKGDEHRKSAEFLTFAQVKPGMKVLDVSSGGGATAALLAAAVGSKGEVFNDPVPKGTPPLDLVTINMSYHDIVNTPADRAALNKRLYDALKPGGHLVIIDNAAKKGSGLSATKTLHRIDEDTVVDEVTKAGFKVDARSDYLRAPSDPRELPFFEMKGAPDDKFAIRFVKK